MEHFNYSMANFCVNSLEKQMKWHLNLGSPVVSSPLLHDGILAAATYDSWIRGATFTGKNSVWHDHANVHFHHAMFI